LQFSFNPTGVPSFKISVLSHFPAAIRNISRAITAREISIRLVGFAAGFSALFRNDREKEGHRVSFEFRIEKRRLGVDRYEDFSSGFLPHARYFWPVFPGLHEAYDVRHTLLITATA